jgi:hypothetical protein
MATLKGLIARYNVRADSQYVGDHTETYETPYGGKGSYRQNDYKVTLKMERRQMTVDFHQGEGITKDPTAYDVLYCLIADASGIDSGFEDWAREFGYDTDSRKAEGIYKTIQDNTKKLRKFLADRWDEFMSSDQD